MSGSWGHASQANLIREKHSIEEHFSAVGIHAEDVRKHQVNSWDAKKPYLTRRNPNLNITEDVTWELPLTRVWKFYIPLVS